MPYSQVLGASSKNTGVCCHTLLQAIFPTQGLNLRPLRLLHWQAGSLPLVPPGKSHLLAVAAGKHMKSGGRRKLHSGHRFLGRRGSLREPWPQRVCFLTRRHKTGWTWASYGSSERILTLLGAQKRENILFLLSTKRKIMLTASHFWVSSVVTRI